MMEYIKATEKRPAGCAVQIAREKNLFTEFCPKMVESATRIAEALLKQ